MTQDTKRGQEKISVGMTVTLQSETLDKSMNGASATVQMIFSEPCAYTGDRVKLYEVLVNGRTRLRVQRHEIKAVL